MSVNDAQFGDDRRSYVGPNSTLPRDLYYAFSNSLDRSKAFNVRQLVDAAAHKLDSLLCGEINAGTPAAASPTVDLAPLVGCQHYAYVARGNFVELRHFGDGRCALGTVQHCEECLLIFVIDRSKLAGLLRSQGQIAEHPLGYGVCAMWAPHLNTLAPDGKSGHSLEQVTDARR